MFVHGGEVRIEPGNSDIWRVLKVCKRQWRVGFSGYVGLDFGTIRNLCHDMDIITVGTFWEKMSILEDEIMELMNGNAPVPCDDDQRARCSFEYGEYLEWSCNHCERRK